MEWRFKFGFCEWLSNNYYHEDMLSVSLLYALAEDEEIKTKAAMVMDLIFFDMALNSFHGAFGSTHGRTYEKEKKWPSNDHTGSAQMLLFGMNGLLPAIILMVLPFLILWGLIRILPPWWDEEPPGAEPEVRTADV